MRLQKVGSFDTPVYVTAPPGDSRRLFVVEQGGKIRVVKGGKTLATPFLDVRDKVTTGGEQGLLSMAFAPDYATSGRFYVYYTDGDGNTQVVEYQRASADSADAGVARARCSRYDSPSPTTTAACCSSGPTGSSTSASATAAAGATSTATRGNAQNLGTLLGKILRIDPRASGGKPYTVPPTTRSSGAPARAARSTATACATRGASRSTARPAT